MKGLARSFAGGEITPEMFGRLDTTRYQTGLQRARNFWILPHGPAENRPGTVYAVTARDSSQAVRIIRFSFSSTDTVILEFGHLYIRFIVNGAPTLETGVVIDSVTPGTTTVLNETAHPYVVGDWLYLSGFSQAALTNRYVKVSAITANTFTVTDLFGANIDTTAQGSTGGTAQRLYTISSPYAASDLFAIRYTQSADVMSLTHPSYAPRELRRSGVTSWQLATITFGPSIGTPSAPTAAGTGGGGNPRNHVYAVTALKTGTLEESLPSADSAAVSLDLTNPANTITITMPSPPTDTVRFNVYKRENGVLAFIGQAAVGSTLLDDNIDPDQLTTPPQLFSVDLNASGYYPAAVGYVEQRRAFGGSNNLPQSFELTRSGTESNTTFSVPQQDDDLIAGRIVANEVHRILHFVSVREPLMLALDGEWTLAAVNSDVLTPSTTAAKPVSAEGASSVQPIIAGTNVLFAHSSGRRVIELKFVDGYTRYNAFDASLFIPHILRGRTIVDAGYARVPNRMGFFVLDDGTMLGLTYQPEHEVLAWHLHSTQNGAIESVACVREGAEDSIYVVVRRTINSQTVRHIERWNTRYFVNAEDAHFVDAGVIKTGHTGTLVSGLWHLVGQTVKVAVGGATHPDRTVSSTGTITLQEAPASPAVVHIGYGITADFQTLPLTTEARGIGALGKGHLKNVNEAYLNVYRSQGLSAGPDFDSLRPYPARTYEPYGSPPALKSEELRLTIGGKWAQDGSVAVRQTDPLPVTLLSLVLDTEFGN